MKIRDALKSSVPVSLTSPRSNNDTLSSFEPVPEGDILKILNSPPTCVTPFLKKPNLDRNLLKNYRPFSNLGFISKLIEKVVTKQMNSYIDSEGFTNVNQSA